jgi:hypothetical protein
MRLASCMRTAIDLRRATMAIQSAAITWKRDFERGLEEARSRQLSALLDFSAAPM